jgi:hypothetical protein
MGLRNFLTELPTHCNSQLEVLETLASQIPVGATHLSDPSWCHPSIAIQYKQFDF